MLKQHRDQTLEAVGDGFAPPIRFGSEFAGESQFPGFIQAVAGNAWDDEDDDALDDDEEEEDDDFFPDDEEEDDMDDDDDDDFDDEDD